MTIQAQVLELMRKLKAELNTSTILITHDLGVVAEMCDKVAIMYCGMIMEYGTLRDVYKNPAHPYTQGLFDSLPDLDTEVPRLKPIPGMVPDPTELPAGCRLKTAAPARPSAAKPNVRSSERSAARIPCAAIMWRKENNECAVRGKEPEKVF